MDDREIIACLNACGFKPDLRERYLVFAKAGESNAQLRLLQQQRKLLMEALHAVQRQVDTIDFIILSLGRD